jgi:hypothetical protein
MIRQGKRYQFATIDLSSLVWDAFLNLQLRIAP